MNATYSGQCTQCRLMTILGFPEMKTAPYVEAPCYQCGYKIRLFPDPQYTTSSGTTVA